MHEHELTQGSCPVCGLVVPRFLALFAPGLVETYACPVDGPVRYGPQAVSVRDWVRQPDKLST